ncbi:List-Bact-rpt repeat protein, partial [Longicatena caecimuris]
MKEWMKQLGVLFLVFMMALTILPSQGTIKAEETKESFTVHYHKNDGTDEIIDKEYASKEEAIEEGSLFTWEGRTFVAWNLQADGKGKRIAEKTKLNEVMKDETTLDVYAIWKEKVFKVNFMDINGDKETIYHEEETKAGKITLPVYRNSEHENEVFAGWKNEKDSKVYEPGKEIEIKEDSTFVAQFMKKEIKAKGTKDLEIIKIIYYSANNERLEKIIKGTDIINYPEEFRESGLETREFLYWAASITAYIDESVPRIKPEEDITKVDFSEYVYIHNGEYSIELYAIYKTDQVTLSFDYITKDDKLITSKEITKPFSYHYVTEEDGCKIYKFTTGEVTMPEVKINDIKSVYTWIPGFCRNSPPIRSKAQNDLYRTEYEPTKTYEFTNEIPDYIILETLIYGYIHLYGEYTGIKVIYEKGDLQGEPPVDNNIYGYAPGQKDLIKIANQGTLQYEAGELLGWFFSNITLKKGASYSYSYIEKKLQASYEKDSDILYLYPIYLPSNINDFFDLSDLPKEINLNELAVIFCEDDNSMLRLPDISDAFDNTNYVFVGWKYTNSSDKVLGPGEPFYLENSEDIKFKPVFVKKDKFNIIYDCPDDIQCPIDSKTYTIGENIEIKDMNSEGLMYQGQGFSNWVARNGVDLEYNYMDEFGRIKRRLVHEYFDFIEDGVLRLTPKYNSISLDDYVICDPNIENANLYVEGFQHYIPVFSNPFYVPCKMPYHDDKYFIGWSTTSDNKGKEFLSYWATIEEYKSFEKLIKNKERPVRLYAQWIDKDTLSEMPGYVKVTIQKDQGNGRNLSYTTYMRAGVNVKLADILERLPGGIESELCKDITYDYSLEMHYLNDLMIIDKDGMMATNVTIPDNVTEITYEIKIRDIPIRFYASSYGNLIDKNGYLRKTIKNDGINTYLQTLELPIPKADEGYRFVGWKVDPYFVPLFKGGGRTIDDLKKNFNVVNWYTLKKEIWSTEELSKTPIYEGNLVDSLLPPYARSYLLSELNVIAVFEPTGKVEYYYDGVKDDEATEILTDLHTGDTVTAYPDKSKDGMYEVAKTDGLPMIVDDDYTKNVIKVYYKKKKTAVTV